MIENKNDSLSLTKQCHLLSLSRSSIYYKPKGENALNLQLMKIIDAQYLETQRWSYMFRQLSGQVKLSKHVGPPLNVI